VKTVNSLMPVLRSRVMLVWALLIAVTFTSWALGTDHGIGLADNHAVVSATIICIALVKVRLVGMHFMEIATAPRPLRLLLDGYCVAAGVLLLSMYVAV
jgi:hypothetical protein